MSWWVVVFHKRTVWSSLPLARVEPLGLNATLVTASVWPVSGGSRGCWVVVFHNRTEPSAMPAARIEPSGFNATLETSSEVVITGGGRG
jgi:hypothetical protein